MTKTVVAFGAFDLLNPGHLHYLEEAAKYGSLIVVVARDDTIKKLTGKAPLTDENSRLEIVRSIKFVHTAVLGERIERWNDIYEILRIFDPDYVALGYNQKIDMKYLRLFLKNGGFRAKIVRTKAYHGRLFNKVRFKRIMAEDA